MKQTVRPSATPRAKLVYSVAALLLSITSIGSMTMFFQGDPVKAQTIEGQFYCISTKHKKSGKTVPTTIFWTSRGKIPIVRWVRSMSNYWTQQRRCDGFSKNINNIYKSNGSKFFLTNSIINGSKVICSTNEVDGDCKSVLMTLRPTDNSLLFLNELKDVLYGKSTENRPIAHSSGEPQLYYQIDMSELLEKGSKAE